MIGLLASFTIGVFPIASLATSTAASAEEAYVIRTGKMRAGPDYDFPSIRSVSRGNVIDVYGCTRGYEWCDIRYRGDRGWFPGDNIAFDYAGRRAPLPWVAPLLGLIILDFAIDDYWGRYYYNRPWFNRRDHWHDWRPREPRHRPPAPSLENWPKRITPQSPPPYQSAPRKSTDQPVPRVNPPTDGQHKKKFCPPGQICN